MRCGWCRACWRRARLGDVSVGVCANEVHRHAVLVVLGVVECAAKYAVAQTFAILVDLKQNTVGTTIRSDRTKEKIKYSQNNKIV